MDCTIRSDFLFSQARCWYVGAGGTSIAASGHTTFLHWAPINTVEGKPSRYVYSGVDTWYDDCLPGPTSCSYSFNAQQCPQGYTAMSSGTAGGLAGHVQTMCCPSASALSPYLNTITVGGIKVEGFSGDWEDWLTLCEYDWSTRVNVDDVVTRMNWEAARDNSGNYTLWVRALTAGYTSGLDTFATLSTPAPSSTPFVVSSTTAMPSSGPTSAQSIGTPHNTSEAAGLDRGAKIGIGVGVSVGGLALASVIGIVLFLLRRRRRRKDPQRDVHDEAADTFHKTELPNEPMPRHTVLSEKYSEPVYELADSGQPAQIGEASTEELGSVAKTEGKEDAAERSADVGATPTVKEPVQEHVGGNLG